MTVFRSMVLAALLFALFLSPAAADAQGGGDVLQFTSGGHALGFGPDAVYLATGTHALRIEFVGGSKTKPTAQGGAAPSAGKAAPLSAVSYQEIWRGISLQYEAASEGIAESTWTIAPRSDPSRIRLRYNVPVTIQADGSLKLAFKTGVMTESRPSAWQEVDGKRVGVKVDFKSLGESEIGFVVGEYDSSRVLKIDPVVKWHTFLGSERADSGNALFVDGAENCYVVGTSYLAWETGLRVNTGGQNHDAFVAKLSRRGALLWVSFLGSTDIDWGQAVAVDAESNVYVGGTSYATWGSPLRAHGGGIGAADAFVAKLNANGVLQWNTFLGGDGFDSLTGGLAYDGAGNLFAAGRSPSAWGVPSGPYMGGDDAFVAKMDTAGTLVWHGFYGSAGDDVALGVAAAGGYCYLTGSSTASWGGPRIAHAGGTDALVVKLDGVGTVLWNTFLGSTGADAGEGIAPDQYGNVYVSGTSSQTWGSPVSTFSGGSDAFAVRLDALGNLVWNTFLGGTTNDSGGAIRADTYEGPLTMIGLSQDSWGSPVQGHGPAGQKDLFIARLADDGTLRQNTFLGSPIDDAIGGMAPDPNWGGVFVTGTSEAFWGGPKRSYQSQGDAFVTRVDNDLSFHSPVKQVDFARDGYADILWRHDGGNVQLWDGADSNGTWYLKSSSPIGSADPSWRIDALGDFDGDGATDILWRHTSGLLYTWLMQGSQVVAAGSPGSVDPSWEVSHASDFNADGKADILWRHAGGTVHIWLMDGMGRIGQGSVKTVDPSWRIVPEASDFDGDGKGDILWRHVGGTVYVWLMDGMGIVGEGSPKSVDPSWTITDTADHDCDGKSDIYWRHSSGMPHLWRMDGTAKIAEVTSRAVDTSWELVDVLDMGGDGWVDEILWRHLNGDVYLWRGGMLGALPVALGWVDPAWGIVNR